MNERLWGPSQLAALYAQPFMECVLPISHAASTEPTLSSWSKAKPLGSLTTQWSTVLSELMGWMT